MTSTNKTLDLYREADDDQRLGLFLFHRELREEFAKIELAEAEAVEDQKGSQSSKPGIRYLAENLMALFKARDFPGADESRSTT